MPSPTSSTRPVSRASSFVPISSICWVMTEVISLGLSLSAMRASGHELGAEGLEPAPHGTVVDLVADLHDEPAEQPRLDADQRVELVPEVLGLPVAGGDGQERLGVDPGDPGLAHVRRQDVVLLERDVSGYVGLVL